MQDAQQPPVLVIDVPTSPVTATKVHDVVPPSAQSAPIQLTFKQVRYAITSVAPNPAVLRLRGWPLRRTERVILDDVSGYVRAGEMVALMGGSGAGKSTLLDILAGIPKRGKLSGTVRVNNRDVRQYRRVIGYVSQDDYLMGTQTVREALTFYIRLKSPRAASAADRERLLEEILEVLDLKKIENNLIGTEKRRGISGGEKKRVSIGCELVTDPGIVYLDEPTTGLDSFSSLNVIDALRKLASKGKTIVCTIHQPRPLIFAKFDKVLMLSRGRVVYFGSPAHVERFLGDAGFDVTDNAADAIMDAIALENTNERGKELLAEAVGGRLGAPLESVYARQKPRVDAELAELEGVDQEPLRAPAGAPLGFFELVRRQARNALRDPSQVLGQIFSKVFFALLIGSIFFRIDNDQQGARDKAGVLFFIMTSSVMSSMDAMIAFVQDRVLMRRESGKGLYTVASYYFSTLLFTAPFTVLYPTIYAAIAYPMLGLRPGFTHFLVFWGDVVLCNFISQALYYAIAAVSPTVTVAQIISPIVVVIFMIFSGFFIQRTNIIGFWLWAYYLSFFRYAFELLMINEFAGLALVCADGELVGGECPFPTGDAFLASLEITSSILVNFFVLAGFLLAFQVIVFVALHLFYREKR